jgi:hypothetical protein
VLHLYQISLAFKYIYIKINIGIYVMVFFLVFSGLGSLYRGLSIDASYHVSVHLAEGFQRTRLKCEKLSEDRRRTQSDGKSSHYLWQGELKTHNYLSPQSTKYQKKDHA